MQFKNFVLSSRFWMSLCLKIGKFYNHSWQFLFRFHFLTNFVAFWVIKAAFVLNIFTAGHRFDLADSETKKRETKHIS